MKLKTFLVLLLMVMLAFNAAATGDNEKAGKKVYNTEERVAQGKGMFAVAAEDQKNICYGLTIYGKNRIWSIGAKAKYPE